ncbi:MAG: hypothetical protein AAGB46_00565 [Verrucomicrobiota bacterium]
MNDTKFDKLLILLFRLGAFFCFAGWTWTHLYWEGPYGILLWQDSTYDFAQSFGFDWDAFVGSGSNDGIIQKSISLIGWLYLACAVLCLSVRKDSRYQKIALVGGFGLFASLFYAQYAAAQRQLPMLVEHGGQMLSPLLLIMALTYGPRHRITLATALVGFIATFAGHGAYAVNLWPTPSSFYGMTSNILSVDHSAAKSLLLVFGIFDFIVCIGIFTPAIRKYCAFYGFAWGLLTAIARPVAGMSVSLNYWGADLFLHEAILRSPHFIIPLCLYLIWNQPSADKRFKISRDLPTQSLA